MEPWREGEKGRMLTEGTRASRNARFDVRLFTQNVEQCFSTIKEIVCNCQ